MLPSPLQVKSGDRPFDLIGLGEAMVELWASEPLGSAPALRRAFGGDVLNSLVMASRLGRRVGFMSRVGNDPFGESLLDSWRTEGVELSHCPLVSGVNGVYFISRLPGGEREFSYRRGGSAASGLGPQDVDEEYIARSRFLLLSGITQAISEGAQAATLQAAQVAKENGVAVAYDPNFRPTLWEQRTAGSSGVPGSDLQRGELAKSAFSELLPFVDLLLMSHPADAQLVTLPVSGPVELATWLEGQGVPAVAIKRGEHGSLLRSGGKLFEASLASSATVADTSGAGDAWNAGLIHALLAACEPSSALQFANRVASWKIGRYGAIPPSDEELESLGRGVT